MRGIGINSDLPLYNTLSNRDILVLALSSLMVIAVVFMGFLIPSYLKSLLIFLIPFSGFLYVCRGNLNHIIMKVHLSDLGYVVAYAILYYIIAIAVGIALYCAGYPLKPHAIVGTSKDAAFFILFFIQVFGEELFKIGILLSALSLLGRHSSRLGRHDIAIAVLASSFIFAAAHIFAYGSIIQPLLILGIGNIVLIYAYVQSGNLMIPYLSHLIVDLIPLMAAMLL